MDLRGNYVLDSETTKLNAYRLLCLFYANKEIARLSDPDSRDDPASSLERKYFAREMTKLLLSIAISLRVLDDQMNALSEEDERKTTYSRARASVNVQYRCMMFDEMSLREVCNKIIHATTVEPHVQDGTESHRIDEYNWLSWSEAMDQSGGQAGPEHGAIKWRHLTSNIRLGGLKGREQWWHLLEVPTFVDAVSSILEGEG